LDTIWKKTKGATSQLGGGGTIFIMKDMTAASLKQEAKERLGLYLA
jgi:hypothetical protein